MEIQNDSEVCVHGLLKKFMNKSQTLKFAGICI